jgi:polysaccharide export outer membrane protein
MSRLLLLVFCTLTLCSGLARAEAKDGAYLLNPGDVLLVSVWREENLQQEVRVLPDGSITFPLVGRVEVAGLDSTAVGLKVAAKLADYLPEPSVSVVVTGIEGNVVYVLGKVARPGPAVMAGPTSVLQALSMAGGLDKFADEDAIKIVRRKGQAQEILRVEYGDLISGRDMSSNIQLRAGDTLVVP